MRTLAASWCWCCSCCVRRALADAAVARVSLRRFLGLTIYNDHLRRLRALMSTPPT